MRRSDLVRAWRPQIRSWLGIACLVVLAATAVAAFALRSPARASSSTAPTVYVNAPDSPLRGTIDVQASATPSTGRTIVSVDFQISPAGANSWTTFATSTSAPYDGTLDTTTLTNGAYDFRAVATDSATPGETQASAVAPDRTVANNATYVAPPQTGTPLRGSTTLTATSEAGGATPNTVTFQASRAGANAWTSTVGPQLDDFGNPTGNYTTTLDTTTLTDGSYDLRVTAEDGGFDAFQGGLVSNVLVDNTPPVVTLSDPGSQLSGEVPLSSSANDAGSGVASVRFESAPAGTTTWTTIGMATGPPYTARVDTRQLADGSYDLRAEATDSAGNKSTSPVRSGVAVSNPAPQRFDQLTLTNYIAPASRMSLLGEIAGSPQHETWAYGYTDAPPPTVNGAPLPYTSQGQGQLVLLRYTDDSGWSIADVLRKQGGSAFPVGPGDKLHVSGQMTGSGEAWIVLNQPSGGAVFHRAPGGSFLLNQGATDTLAPLVSSGSPRVRLGRAPDGTTYGVLRASTQPTKVVQEPSANGPVSVFTQVMYGQLDSRQLANGGWSVQNQTAPPLPPDYVAPPHGAFISLADVDATGPGTGWGVLAQSGGAVSHPLMLARFDQNGWQFVAPAGLDALDLTDEFAASSHESAAAQNPNVTLTPMSLHADSGGVWLSATVIGDSRTGRLVARYDAAKEAVVNSWCTGLPRQSFGCAHPLDLDHPATVPDAAFDTSEGVVADALSTGSDFVDVYSHGAWTSVPTPGFHSSGTPGQSLFVSPTEGWLAGPNVLAHISSTPAPSALTAWPQANRSPLLSVALAPGQSTTDTPGTLAVGLNGTALHYDPSAGWQLDPTPSRTHHLALDDVAFADASSAFAVGQEGLILRWDGSAWTEDPQSVSLTTSTLNAIAFRADGQGWAVGANGTILHYDGTAWSSERIDAADDGQDVRSVAVAGQDVFALAGGNLIERSPAGAWQRVDPSLLPSPAPPADSMRLLSGLPDGGLVIAGKSLLMVRASASAQLAYAPQSFQGIPVALAAFRDAGGNVRAFVSVAPPIQTLGGLTNDVGGVPSGDGNLIVQTDSGFDDLSRTLSPTSIYAAGGDGAVQPDPVLGVAASPDGSHAWAVGGYAGTHAADGIGTDQILSARPPGWFTSAIWRYDAGGSVASQAVTQTPDDLPASPNTVSFAFFSSPLCKFQCAAVRDAQPDVNLRSAAAQIASFAQQPGGPAFAMLGGNARGPMDLPSFQHGFGATDLAHLPELLSPLGGLPTYAAYGPRDAVPTSGDPAQPWAEAFARAPAPFGSGAAPPGISPVASGDATGSVNKYYAFDASQNGGTLRVIVLDNSAGSLEASAPGQTAWLSARLADAQAAGLPVVVVVARPLDSTLPVGGAASDGDAVATQLAAAGVLGVFTTSGGDGGSWPTQTDRLAQVPANAAPGAAQIPEYEGATLTYQQPKNNGVLWYDVSVDTQAQTLSVKAIPVISNLALAPLNGLSVARSSTLSFQAIARRPPSTLATTPADQGFPGFDQYVNIPARTCSGCIGPSYTFKSSNRVVGDFVVPSGPGSPYPKLDSQGATIRSKTSGLFCAYNSGTTTVSVTAGLLTSSLPVTVRAGGYGPPCGTVPGGVNSNVITLPGRVIAGKALNPGLGSPLAPAGNPAPTPQPKLSLPPAPAPAVHPAPAAPHPQPVFNPAPALTQQAAVGLPPIVVPLIPPALTPVPPGGATVSAQAAAKREEKARKHASQSAYVTRPAGTSASDWFYPAVGAISVLAALMIAGGMRPGPRPTLALVEARESDDTRRRRR